MGDGFRRTAVNCWVKDLLEGSFESKADVPSKVIFNSGQEAERVNIIGTITTILKGIPFRFIIDDGSGQIEVIDFEAERDVKLGDFVRVVALPKEYLNTKYLILEILKKTDSLWLKLKKGVVKAERDIKSEILNFIKDTDSGMGVSFESVEEEFGAGIEKNIDFLLEKGFLFENRPGFFKVLE